MTFIFTSSDVLNFIKCIMFNMIQLIHSVVNMCLNLLNDSTWNPMKHSASKTESTITGYTALLRSMSLSVYIR